MPPNEAYSISDSSSDSSGDSSNDSDDSQASHSTQSANSDNLAAELHNLELRRDSLSPPPVVLPSERGTLQDYQQVRDSCLIATCSINIDFDRAMLRCKCNTTTCASKPEP